MEIYWSPRSKREFKHIAEYLDYTLIAFKYILFDLTTYNVCGYFFAKSNVKKINVEDMKKVG